MHHEFEIEDIVAVIETKFTMKGEKKKDGHKEEQEESVRDTEEE